MGFFKSIEKHLDNINLNMTITKSETGIVVSVLPVLNCKDEAVKNITPILLKGTAEEMDTEFAGIIQQPLETVSGVASNIIEFEQSVTKAKENSAVKKAADDKATKAKTKAEKDAEKAKIKTEKDLEKLNVKADKDLVKAETYVEKKEYGKAIFMIKSALKISPTYDKAIKMLEDTEKLDSAEVVQIFQEEAAEVMMKGEPTSMKEVAVEEQQKSEVESLVGKPKPRRKDLESMKDFDSRLKDWELVNDIASKKEESGVNFAPLSPEEERLSKAMHREEEKASKSPFKEKPELSGMKPNTEFDDDMMDVDDEDEFDDIDF